MKTRIIAWMIIVLVYAALADKAARVWQPPLVGVFTLLLGVSAWPSVRDDFRPNQGLARELSVDGRPVFRKHLTACIAVSMLATVFYGAFLFRR